MTADVLPFRSRDESKTPGQLPEGAVRWKCPCSSKSFGLWTDGEVHCNACGAYHWRISFAVDERPEAVPPPEKQA